MDGDAAKQQVVEGHGTEGLFEADAAQIAGVRGRCDASGDQGDRNAWQLQQA